MKKLICLVHLLAPVVSSGGEPVVKVAGLQVVFDDDGTDFKGYQSYNSSKGYGVVLILRGGGKGHQYVTALDRFYMLDSFKDGMIDSLIYLNEKKY